MNNGHKLRVGGHVSMSGGLDKAVEREAKIEGNCLQIFSGSPRMWRRRDLASFGQQKLFAKQKELDVKPIFTHALYLVNLASDKEELIQKSVRSLIFELKFDSLVKGSGVVVHLGSHQGRGWDSVKEQLVSKIKQILEKTPKDSHLLIENAASKGGKIGADLSNVKWLLDGVNSKRLGWCFDTCHGFAAGYSLSPKSVLNGELEQKDAITTITDLGLWSSLTCIHVNDCKSDFNSGVDRHENIGEGKIPIRDLQTFLQDDRVKQLPLITEAPGFDGNGPDAKNINRIKQLLKGKKI